MARIKKTDIKRLLIFFFATLVYALCQMLFSIIIMKEDLWHNFHIQLSAHYIVIFTMCIADYGLLRLYTAAGRCHTYLALCYVLPG